MIFWMKIVYKSNKILRIYNLNVILTPTYYDLMNKLLQYYTWVLYFEEKKEIQEQDFDTKLII